jgi:arsenical pump membrane protein
MPPPASSLAAWNTAQIAIWFISVSAFVLILWRPFHIPEYVWAAGGAILLIACRLISPADAWSAARTGTSVYLFLFGMMLLAELARQNGVFDWLAELAMRHARGSQFRLFALIYGIGVAVTALLSNDATAVLLTPAVLAVVRRAKTSPLPYLFACAFVANAASILLPISNPSNLIVFGGHLPPLAWWMRQFLLPAISAIAVTFGLLWRHSRKELMLPLRAAAEPAVLTARGIRAGIGVLAAAAAMLATSAMGGPVGRAAAITGVAVMVLVAGSRLRLIGMALRGMVWGVLPLVAGLFVIVRALQGTGALELSTRGLHTAAGWPAAAGLTAIAFGFGLAANAINNLPVGLIGAGALHALHATAAVKSAVLLGVNLGPNLSVTGSLATILWLMALRREGVAMSGWRFLRAGCLVMPCALLAAVLLLAATSR